MFDGDTIEVDGDQVIRLIGVDAPEKEKNDKCRRDEIITKVPAEQIIKNGQEAHRWLSQAVLGRKVELELDREAGQTDWYDRTLAHVWTVASDGKRDGLLAESLIWARHALPTDHAHKYEDRIREAFQEAGRREEVYDLGVPLPTHMRLPDRSGQETPSDNQASPSEITPPSGWEAGKNSVKDPTEENDTGENSTGKGTAEKEASEGGGGEGDSSRKKQSSEKQRPQRSEEFWATVFSRSDSPEPDSPGPDSQEPDLPEPAPTGHSTDRRPENQDRRSSRDDENESNVENPYWERP
ncbi:thermonuclease family protein [Salinibacter grassmerensis]|uniref:thermonuclease family protein n=1 Tax=Salinibacter grassmerensis TaxID=3040353 RepID=UPI0021E980BC|nr:thermonuclease family protein [Salinibacter grassmerensis]